MLLKDINANEIIKKVTDHLIKEMESSDSSKWIKGWTNKSFQNLDGHKYSGMNLFWLSMIDGGFIDDKPRTRKIYGTYIQWKNKGLQVKRGAQSLPLLRPIIGSKDVEVETPKGKEIVTNNYKYFSTFKVFNIEDVEGDISSWDSADNVNNKNEVETSLIAEQYIKNTEAVINHVEGGNAYYVPSKDFIFMPNKSDFIKTETATATDGYYSTLFHELTHWTGAKNRCARDLSGWKGSPDYAFEELVAEMGAAFLCNYLGINSTPRVDHVRYLKSWVQCLKDKPKALINASGQANKALMFLNGLQPKTEFTIQTTKTTTTNDQRRVA